MRIFSRFTCRIRIVCIACIHQVDWLRRRMELPFLIILFLLLLFVAAFPRTLDDSVNLRTFIIYFDVPEELEVKFDSCNSKMENNCFSDIFIGYETSAQHIIIVAPRFSIRFEIGIQIDKSNRRQKEMKKIARTWRQMLVLNGNGSNDAHSIWN